MGSCCSIFGFRPAPIEDPEDSEITRLLQENRGSTPYIFGATSISEVGPSSSGGSSYQNEMSRLIDEVDAAMIDVSGRAFATLDKFEYNFRSKYYAKLIRGLSSDLLRAPENKLLMDNNSEMNLIEAPLISQEDAELMDWAGDEIGEALKEIKVPKQEDFVVPYNITEIPLIQID